MNEKDLKGKIIINTKVSVEKNGIECLTFEFWDGSHLTVTPQTGTKLQVNLKEVG